MFDRPALRCFEQLAPESAALPGRPHSQHAEVTVAAGLLQVNTGNQESVQFVKQDDVARRGDRFKHAVGVDPLPAEEIGLGRPSGFAAVAAERGVHKIGERDGICGRGGPDRQTSRHTRLW
jgi:hypothetical protein